MRGISFLVVIQMLLSGLSAWLMSEMSFWGKLGIDFFYKEYKILKNPFETGAIIFGIQILVILLLWIIYKFFSKKLTNLFALIILGLAITGLIYSYFDFQDEFSHKILKDKFHIGAYLVWVSAMLSAFFFLLKTKKSVMEV